jgi:hypothetical protein
MGLCPGRHQDRQIAYREVGGGVKIVARGKTWAGTLGFGELVVITPSSISTV